MQDAGVDRPQHRGLVETGRPLRQLHVPRHIGDLGRLLKKLAFNSSVCVHNVGYRSDSQFHPLLKSLRCFHLAMPAKLSLHGRSKGARSIEYSTSSITPNMKHTGSSLPIERFFCFTSRYKRRQRPRRASWDSR